MKENKMLRLQRPKTPDYHRFLTGFALAVGLTAFAALTARAADYTAVDLYPMPGADFGGARIIAGAFGGQVVAGDVLWKPDGSSTNLTPEGYFPAQLSGTDGTRQFGTAFYNELARRPVVWTGTAASATFLDQTGLLPLSRINGAGGEQFVGIGNVGLAGNVALLWNSLTATVINLNPANFYSCTARGTSGTQQVGGGFRLVGDIQEFHALLWTGSAASAVDLHPTNLPGIFDYSSAVATDGQQQVGNGDFQGIHALLWVGTANSAVDLNPPGFAGSKASAVANGKQVGYGWQSLTDDRPLNALVWSGTAASAVNLHQFLAPEFNQSRAYGIDAAGQIFGVAFNSTDQQWHAIKWIPLPEPGQLSIAFSGSGLRLTWRGNGFKLQSTASLTPPVIWSDVSGAVSGYVAPLTGPSKYFRLAPAP